MLIGVLADTHGYLDSRLLPLFPGVEAILHAGDIGSRAVIDGLAALAPVYAVEGNNDVALNLGLPGWLDIDLAGVRIHLVHQLADARPPIGTNAVVFGHSHQPLIEQRDGILYLNPGAAGRRGFHRLQTAALLRLEGGSAQPDLLELGPREIRALKTASR
jgi:putative phosphoesterase